MLKLIDYYADWCGPCHQMKPIVEELEKEMADKLQFEERDVDDPTFQQQVQAAGVMSIPTFILVKTNEDGSEEEVDRKLGAMPKEAMVHWLEQHVE